MSPSTRSLLAGALLAAVTLLPACRCDGGVGRKWRGRSLDFTMSQLGRRTCDDTSAFAAHLGNAGELFTPDIQSSGIEISRTINLYTTGKAEACWCPAPAE